MHFMLQQMCFLLNSLYHKNNKIILIKIIILFMFNMKIRLSSQKHSGENRALI